MQEGRRQGDSSHRLDATAHRFNTPDIQFGVKRSSLIFQSFTCRLLSRIALWHKRHGGPMRALEEFHSGGYSHRLDATVHR